MNNSKRKTFKLLGDISQKLNSNQILIWHKNEPSPSSNSQWIASGSRDETIKIWNVNTGACDKTLKVNGIGWIRVLLVLPEIKVLISSSEDCSIQLIHIETGICLQTLIGHYDFVESIIFNKSTKNKIASSSEDETIKIWDINTGICLHTLLPHSSDKTLCLTEIGDRFLSCSNEGIKIWNFDTGVLEKTLLENSNFILKKVLLYIKSNNRLILSTGNKLEIWDLNLCSCVCILSGHTSIINDVLCFKEKFLISGSKSGEILVWNNELCACVKSLKGHSESISSLRILDGLLISGCF